MSEVVIKLALDVVGALESQSMDGNVFALDTNRLLGSKKNGTDSLQTAVSRGTRVTWMVAMVECEVYAALEDIIIDKSIMQPAKQQFPGTSVSYWSGEVKSEVQAPIKYDLVFKIGSLKEPLVLSSKLGIIPAEYPTVKVQE